MLLSTSNEVVLKLRGNIVPFKKPLMLNEKLVIVLPHKGRYRYVTEIYKYGFHLFLTFVLYILH